MNKDRYVTHIYKSSDYSKVYKTDTFDSLEELNQYVFGNINYFISPEFFPSTIKILCHPVTGKTENLKFPLWNDIEKRYYEEIE